MAPSPDLPSLLKTAEDQIGAILTSHATAQRGQLQKRADISKQIDLQALLASPQSKYLLAGGGGALAGGLGGFLTGRKRKRGLASGLSGALAGGTLGLAAAGASDLLRGRDLGTAPPSPGGPKVPLANRPAYDLQQQTAQAYRDAPTLNRIVNKVQNVGQFAEHPTEYLKGIAGEIPGLRWFHDSPVAATGATLLGGVGYKSLETAGKNNQNLARAFQETTAPMGEAFRRQTYDNAVSVATQLAQQNKVDDLKKLLATASPRDLRDQVEAVIKAQINNATGKGNPIGNLQPRDMNQLVRGIAKELQNANQGVLNDALAAVKNNIVPNPIRMDVHPSVLPAARMQQRIARKIPHYLQWVGPAMQVNESQQANLVRKTLDNLGRRGFGDVEAKVLQRARELAEAQKALAASSKGGLLSTAGRTLGGRNLGGKLGWSLIAADLAARALGFNPQVRGDDYQREMNQINQRFGVQ